MTQTVEKTPAQGNHGNTHARPEIVQRMRKQGYLTATEAARYLGMPAEKSSVNSINRWRHQKRIQTTEVSGNFFYAPHDLDTFKSLLEAQQQPVTSLPARSEDQWHPNPLVVSPPSPSVILPYNAQEMQQEEQQEVPEEGLDYAAVYTHAMMLALQEMGRLGIRQWGAVNMEEVPVDITTRVWQARVQTNTRTWHYVRVTLEGGKYTATCTELVPHLEQQITQLKAELAIQKQQVASYRGKCRIYELECFPTSGLKLRVRCEELDGDRRRIYGSDYEFPFSVEGATQERAEAEFRFQLRGYWEALKRANYDDLPFAKQAHYDALHSLFDEEV